MQIMREALDVPRSTYYQSLNQTISNHEKKNIELNHEMKKRDSATKKHVIKRIAGYTVGINLVQRLRNKTGMRSIDVKNFLTTPSKEKVIERDNLLERDISTKTIHEKWVGDITYIH